jgi:hypothetical protein
MLKAVELLGKSITLVTPDIEKTTKYKSFVESCSSSPPSKSLRFGNQPGRLWMADTLANYVDVEDAGEERCRARRGLLTVDANDFSHFGG